MKAGGGGGKRETDKRRKLGDEIGEREQFFRRGTNLSNLLFASRLGGLSERVVVRLDDQEIGRLRVDHQLTGRVIEGRGHLVEDHTQFLQRQNPV